MSDVTEPVGAGWERVSSAMPDKSEPVRVAVVRGGRGASLSVSPESVRTIDECADGPISGCGMSGWTAVDSRSRLGTARS